MDESIGTSSSHSFPCNKLHTTENTFYQIVDRHFERFLIWKVMSGEGVCIAVHLKRLRTIQFLTPSLTHCEVQRFCAQRH